MDQQRLPLDMLEAIAGFADIDGRRALGFAPRKLAVAATAVLERLIERKIKCQLKRGDRTLSTFIVGRAKDASSVKTAVVAFDSVTLAMSIAHTTGDFAVVADGVTHTGTMRSYSSNWSFKLYGTPPPRGGGAVRSIKTFLVTAAGSFSIPCSPQNVSVIMQDMQDMRGIAD
jgi:hypothetical protein